MGHKNSAKPQFNSAVTAAQTPSAYETRRAGLDNQVLDAFDSKDYRDPSKFGIFPNLFDPAERARQRELQMGAHPQGAAALGGGSETALALDRQNIEDHDAEDAAANYQQQVQGAVDRARGDLTGLQNSDMQRRMGVLDTTAGVYRQQMQQPSWFDRLLGSATQVGSALAGNPAFVAAMRRGGRTDAYVGKPVLVGEEGRELALADDGGAQVLGDGGPEVVVPQKPGVVVPAAQTRAMLGAGGVPEFLRWRGRAVDPSEDSASPRQLSVDPSEDSATSQTMAAGAQGGTAPATRPRRVSQPMDAYARARAAASRIASNPNAPVEETPGPVYTNAPSPQPALTSPSSVALSEPAPMTGKVRAQPAPSEEEVNDARFKVRAAAAGLPGVPPDSLDATDSRPRWSDPVDQEQERNAALHEIASHPTNKGRLAAIAKMSLLGFLRGGPGGAMAGAITGAVDPSLPNALKYGAQAAQSDARLNQLRTQRRDDLADDQSEAQTEWLKSRPALEQEKIDERARAEAARAEDAHKRSLLAQLRGYPSIDPQKHAAFLDEWQRTFGEPLDVDAFNNKKGNVTVRGIITDPSKPQEKHDVAINLATGEARDLGLSGFTQPVGQSGMTAKQEADVKLGGERLGEEKYHHRVTEAQGDARDALSRQRFDFQRAVNDQRTSERGRKELADANKIAAQSEQYARAAQDLEGKTTFRDPDTGEVKESKKWAAKRDEYLSKAAALRRQFADNYGYLFAPSDGEAPRMTLEQFRGLFPNSAGSPAAEASRLGITLSDTDQGVRGPASPMPRRGAPAHVRDSAPAPAQSKGNVSRAKFRAKFPQYQGASDAEVDSLIGAQGYTPQP